MNWKEQFDKQFNSINGDTGSGWIEGERDILDPFKNLNDIKNFISTEIIEKLIDGIEEISIGKIRKTLCEPLKKS